MEANQMEFYREASVRPWTMDESNPSDKASKPGRKPTMGIREPNGGMKEDMSRPLIAYA